MITQRLTVKGLGKVVYSDGTLVDNVRDLKGRLITLRNEAYARIHTSGNENIGNRYLVTIPLETDGTRVALELDYMRREAPVLSRYNKLSPALAKQVVKANFEGKYYCTDSTRRYETKRKLADKQEKQGLASEKRTAITLPRNYLRMTLTQKRKYLDFIFQDLAEQYFELNGNFPISFHLIDKDVVDRNQPDLLTNPNGTIVIPYVWFESLIYRSMLFGEDRLTNPYHHIARGIV